MLTRVGLSARAASLRRFSLSRGVFCRSVLSRLFCSRRGAQGSAVPRRFRNARRGAVLGVSTSGLAISWTKGSFPNAPFLFRSNDAFDSFYLRFYMAVAFDPFIRSLRSRALCTYSLLWFFWFSLYDTAVHGCLAGEGGTGRTIQVLTNRVRISL